MTKLQLQQLRELNKKKLLEKEFSNYEVSNEMHFEFYVHKYLVKENGFNVYFEKLGDSIFDYSTNLIKEDLFDFIKTSQQEEWDKFATLYSSENESKLENRFIEEMDKAIEKEGLIQILRHGFNINKIHFNIFGNLPSSKNSEKQNKLYESNVFTCIQEFHYTRSEQYKKNRIDLVLFINGFPLITVELKKSNQQSVYEAIEQYKTTRQPDERFFKQNYRSVVYFAMSDTDVFFTTKLDNEKTKFLPFNKGNDSHGGNPIVPGKYPTHYMWEEIFTKESLINIFQNFVFVYKEHNEEGIEKNSITLWPRFHQLNDLSRTKEELLKYSSKEWWNGKDLADKNIRHHFLFANAPGSGKTHEIGWLSFLLAKLKDKENNNYFDSIIIVTDRKVVDRQLQEEIKQLDNAYHNDSIGYYQILDDKTTSTDLENYLNKGTRIIVTTIHKFSRIKGILKTKDKNYGVIIDEAHSSTSSDLKNNMEKVLNNTYIFENNTEKKNTYTFEPEKESESERTQTDEEKETDVDSDAVTYFTFTATPKPITKELFGIPNKEGKPEAWACYSIQQAIEEEFILDVLKRVIIYELKGAKIEKVIDENPILETGKTIKKIKNKIIDCSPEVISKKCEVIAKNFPFVLSSLNGEGKCMIVAPSVKSVLVYKQCLENLPEFKNQKIFVAFTGKVDGQTESSINGFSDEKTAIEFNKSENKILIVCNKFQTGFDQPKLTTLFVDQPLFGVHAVQTYSRLNRIRNNKETLIVDFVNTMNDIIQSFQPFFVPTVLDSSDFDQKEFEKVMQEIKSENFYTSEELERFNEILRMKYNKKDKLDENDDKEFVNILLQINNRIHNKQKYTDIQISDFEQRFKYLVKWYPIIYSIFKLKYDDEYRLFKCLEKSFPRPERGWNPIGKVDLKNANIRLVGEYYDNVVIPQTEITLKSPVVQTTPITLQQCLDEIIKRINMYLEPNLMPSKIEKSVRNLLEEAVKKINGDEDLMNKIANANNSDNKKLEFLGKALTKEISNIYKNNEEYDGEDKGKLERLLDKNSTEFKYVLDVSYEFLKNSLHTGETDE